MKNEFHHIDSIKYLNEKGESFLSIKHFGLGDYLITRKPIAINWYDCHGSAGKYVCLLEDNKDVDGEQLLKKVRNILNSGDEINFQHITNDIEEFLTVFPNGNLEITIYDPNKYPIEKSEFHLKFNEWDIVFPRIVRKQQELSIAGKFLKYFEENVQKTGRPVGDIVDFTSGGYYDVFTDYFVATQQESVLSNERIEYYEALIKSGKRPYCLIFNTTANDKSNNYLLDGHHKLIAYKKLKIKPRVIEISQVVDEHYLFDWDIQCKEIYTVLFEWQSKHIFDNSFQDEKLIRRIIANPENPFNNFIKQGYSEEYWINGNIKAKGQYIDNKKIGTFEFFYETGKPKSMVEYKNGKQIRNLKAWFHTGELMLDFKKTNNQFDGTVERYHRNGKISTIQTFINRKPADGVSSVAYDQNGNKTYEATYENGQTINSKWFDQNGKITQEYDR